MIENLRLVLVMVGRQPRELGVLNGQLPVATGEKMKLFGTHILDCLLAHGTLACYSASHPQRGARGLYKEPMASQGDNVALVHVDSSLEGCSCSDRQHQMPLDSTPSHSRIF